jgi:hypothetical protein
MALSTRLARFVEFVIRIQLRGKLHVSIANYKNGFNRVF